MSIVTVSPKFQVVIPLQIRETLGLKPGQKVEALQYLDRVEFIPVRTPRAMRGFLRGINTHPFQGHWEGRFPPLRMRAVET
jgi:AbrB family looped-hinge helix DNA binding protein